MPSKNNRAEATTRSIKQCDEGTKSSWSDACPADQIATGGLIMSKQIPGVPEGWELVRIDKPTHGEWLIDGNGQPKQHPYKFQCGGFFPIIRKIEKPAKYRPFANAEEFKPHRDRWVQYASPSVGDRSAYRASAYTSERVWLGPDNLGKTYKVAFDCLSFDDDGTPFGVKIDE